MRAWNRKNANKVRRCRKNYRHTMHGLLKIIYSHQEDHSKRKGADRLAVCYSFDEFKKWTINQPKFQELFTKWVASDYNKLLTPSFDRTDPRGNYEFSNIIIMTWEENKAKGQSDHWISVLQYSIESKFIKKYNSITEAAIAVGNEERQPGIVACCKGKKKQAYSFKWRYALWPTTE